MRSPVALALIAVLALLGCVAASPSARADGDPGSDELVFQNLFVGSDSGVSFAQQESLGELLDATAAARAPIRVAIIAHPDDLGVVTALWGNPAGYARYLAIELSLSYAGRLLVVMPDGIAAARNGLPDRTADRLLATIRVGPGAPGLVTATDAAVRRLESAAGVKLGSLRGALAAAERAAQSATQGPGLLAPVPAASRPAAPGSGGGWSAWALALVLVLALLAPFVAPALLRAAHRLALKVARAAVGNSARRLALPSMAVVLAMVALGAVALAARVTRAPSQAEYLETNPDLDPGSPLHPVPAPGFTLTDQTGRTVSLRQFRGKVVLLAFTDAECQTICPLTTSAMLDAKRALGAAGSQVQLLGIDANPRSTSIEDVASYTQLHGLLGAWDFLTGPLPLLDRIWGAYGIEHDITAGLVSHTPALFAIDPQGRLRELYLTTSSYGAIPQFGQVLAREASRLLPSHPRVLTDISYAPVAGIGPSESYQLPRLDSAGIASGAIPHAAGDVELGPGAARLYLFFATWDVQSTSLAANLELLNDYARDAAKFGLPPLTAIDEGSVEPSPAALPDFIRTLAHPLAYPVAIDTTGRVADGYEVEGQPWFVLVSPAGRIVWYQEVYTSGWPALGELDTQIRAALGTVVSSPSGKRQELAGLAGSPAPLAAIHRQAAQLLSGEHALRARLRALRGYPIVLNTWASWCEACQAEFGLMASAAVRYGKRVAFLGADTDDASGDAQAFLRQHFISYPSYEVPTESALDAIWPPGISGLPTTLLINRHGEVVHVNDGAYLSQGTLDQQIETYLLAP